MTNGFRDERPGPGGPAGPVGWTSAGSGLGGPGGPVGRDPLAPPPREWPSEPRPTEPERKGPSMIPVFVVAGLILLATLIFVHRSGTVRLNPGYPAPEIYAEEWYNLGAGEGAPSLAALQGQVVVVEFWATNCKYCRQVVPHLNELHQKYADRGVVILALSREDAETVGEFVESLEMSYRVGAGSESGDDYGVEGIPHAFVVNRAGQVVWEGLGYPLAGLDQALEAALAQ